MEKSNREESNFLQRAVSDDNVQRASEKEIQSSEVQPDVLREKTVQDSLLSQGSKPKQVSNAHQIFTHILMGLFSDCLALDLLCSDV